MVPYMAEFGFGELIQLTSFPVTASGEGDLYFRIWFNINDIVQSSSVWVMGYKELCNHNSHILNIKHKNATNVCRPSTGSQAGFTAYIFSKEPIGEHIPQGGWLVCVSEGWWMLT